MVDLENIHSYIYGLVDPRTNEIFYVGITENPKGRLGQHIWTVRSSRGNYASKQYIISLLDVGIRPQMVILDQIKTSRREPGDHMRSYALENHWINAAQAQGMAWCNNTSTLDSDRQTNPISTDALNQFMANKPDINREPNFIKAE